LSLLREPGGHVETRPAALNARERRSPPSPARLRCGHVYRGTPRRRRSPTRHRPPHSVLGHPIEDYAAVSASTPPGLLGKAAHLIQPEPDAPVGTWKQSVWASPRTAPDPDPDEPGSGKSSLMQWQLIQLGPAIKIGLVEAGGIDSKSGLRRADAHPPRRQTRTPTNPSPRSAHRTRSEASSNFNRQFRREYGIIPGQY
jgi:hypothetical protein